MEPVNGGVQVNVLPPVELTINCVVGVKHEIVNADGATKIPVGAVVLMLTAVVAEEVQPFKVLVIITE